MQADTLHAYLESVFYKLGDDPVLTASQDSITKKGLVNSLPDITAINEITWLELVNGSYVMSRTDSKADGRPLC